jgi:four helix bundle protein
VHKAAIAAKEVRETVYWLNLIGRAGLAPTDRLEHLLAEGRQLVAILTASVRTAKRGEHP